VKKDFNQCQQSWWKIIEITTAISLFFNILPKLLQSLFLAMFAKEFFDDSF